MSRISTQPWFWDTSSYLNTHGFSTTLSTAIYRAAESPFSWSVPWHFGECLLPQVGDFRRLSIHRRIVAVGCPQAVMMFIIEFMAESPLSSAALPVPRVSTDFLMVIFAMIPALVHTDRQCHPYRKRCIYRCLVTNLPDVAICYEQQQWFWYESYVRGLVFKDAILVFAVISMIHFPLQCEWGTPFLVSWHWSPLSANEASFWPTSKHQHRLIWCWIDAEKHWQVLEVEYHMKPIHVKGV